MIGCSSDNRCHGRRRRRSMFALTCKANDINTTEPTMATPATIGGASWSDETKCMVNKQEEGEVAMRLLIVNYGCEASVILIFPSFCRRFIFGPASQRARGTVFARS